MNLIEYKKTENLSYAQYCNYLQNKYGIGTADYMTKDWKKNRKASRTSEGLFAHHRFENRAARLCEQEIAKKHPLEWQSAQNIIYCDFLEHFFLHILICEENIDTFFFAENNEGVDTVGIGGIFQYFIPELNDVYSGWQTSQDWRKKCHNKIINDKDVYLTLLKRFNIIREQHPLLKHISIKQSANASYGQWDIKHNQALFNLLEKL